MSDLGGEVALLEDRLEKWANRNLMKFKGKCQASPLGQRKLTLQYSCEGQAGVQLCGSGVGSGGQVGSESAGHPGNKGCSHVLVSISTSRASGSSPSIDSCQTTPKILCQFGGRNTLL